jgi:hypothetical protein
VLASRPSGFYRARKFLRRHRTAAFGAAAALALILASGLTVWWIARRDSPTKSMAANMPANKGAIVLGEFTNSTGDPAFDGSLRQVLAGGARKTVRIPGASRCADEPDAPPDGPARGYEAKPGHSFRNLRADRKRGGGGRFHHEPGQRSTSVSLHAQRIAGPVMFWIEEQASAGKKDACLQGAGSKWRTGSAPGPP